MITTQDPQEFIASPLGRCLVGPSYVIWCAAPDLMGVTLWGALSDRCIREMMEVGEFIRHPDIATRRRSLIDLHDIETVDAEVLLDFKALARERVPRWSAGTERQAIVIPDGLEGILLAGTLPSLGVSHPLRIVEDLEPALEFLEHPAAAQAYAEVAAIAAAAQGHAELLTRLRTELRRDLTAATIGSCATALGMSTRTLQRVLRGLDTSFSDELRRVRVATAETLLVHSALKIGAIASQLGFGSSSRMSATLRRERNLTASALRANAELRRAG